jgi:Reverse transcriptase (RNA-dependent DNA polymerase)
VNDTHAEGRYQEVTNAWRYAKLQTTETYLGLLRERGKRGLPVKRVYRQLYNTNLYLTAYGRVYRNAGAMTPGVIEETADGTSLETFEAIIAALKQERYQWQPARRTSILKKNGKKRPLGIPVWSDKLLAEVMRMILDAYFDGTFSEHSHGFREGRGCHTALREIYRTWQGTVWIIEGDIADCFGSLDHNLIISALAEHIQDGRFLNLVKKLLDAGYMEDWKLNNTFSGVPQGGLCKALHNPPYAKQVTMQRDVRKTLIPSHFQLNFLRIVSNDRCEIVLNYLSGENAYATTTPERSTPRSGTGIAAPRLHRRLHDLLPQPLA